MRAFSSIRLWSLAIALLLIAGICTPARSAAPNGAKAAAAPKNELGRYRALAPGVEITVPVEDDQAALSSRHDVVEILASDPQFGERSYSQGISKAKDVRFEHDVWGLEFTFKSVRFVDVDIPTPSGRMQRKQVWYLVYRVRNPGKAPVRFIPRFILESWDTGKAYPARLIPVALNEVRKREDTGRRVLNTSSLIPDRPSPLLDIIQIAGEIPPSTADADHGVWGVATWEDIDPATDHFSIYVQGLTSAYRWEDAKQGEPASYVYKRGDAIGTGRRVRQKTLRLNFWRPGDEFYEHEREIRFGYHKHKGDDRFKIPEKEKVDYVWVYR